MNLRRSTFALLLVAVAACDSGKATSAASVAADAAGDAGLSDRDIDELFDHALTFMESSADVVERDVGDCAAMGRDLESARTKNAELIRQIQHVYGSLTGERRARFEDRYRARYHAAWAKIRPGILKCRHVPEVDKVVRELAGE